MYACLHDLMSNCLSGIFRDYSAPQWQTDVSDKNLFSNLFALTDYFKYYPIWENGTATYLHWYLKFFYLSNRRICSFYADHQIFFFYFPPKHKICRCVGLPLGGSIVPYRTHLVFLPFKLNNILKTSLTSSNYIFLGWH